MQISNLNEQFLVIIIQMQEEIYIVHQTICVLNKSNGNFARIVCNILFVLVVWVEDFLMLMARRRPYSP